MAKDMAICFTNDTDFALYDKVLKSEAIKKTIISSKRYGNIKQYIVDCCDDINLEWITNDKVLVALIVAVFSSSDSFYIVEYPSKWYVGIFQTNAFKHELEHCGTQTLKVNNVLLSVKKIFSSKSEFSSIIDMQINFLDEYEKMLEDLKTIKMIDRDFANCKFEWEIRNWKPIYMLVGTNTSNTDIAYWKEKLGPYRRITSDVENNTVQYLKVQKKHKYWK